MFTEFAVRIGRVQSFQEQQPQLGRSQQHASNKLPEGARGCWFAVTFPTKPKSLGYIVFRNFYTASIRIEQQNMDGSTVVLLPGYRLMQHAHCEDDAQNWHLLAVDKFQTKIDYLHLESLYIYLFQPCPTWEKWELQHLKFYESCKAPLATSGGSGSGSPKRNRGLRSPPTSPRDVPSDESHLLLAQARQQAMQAESKAALELAQRFLQLTQHVRQLVVHPQTDA
ncbi:TPA: hypothetical protein N0F65_004255 [Lagenidium giganteum]|uniref:Uncharacterized protein n=1 Tax=Lagenidium giganteum TaxID=4803 RepID=A0AAV2ZBK0_9STRA|nr:TPA: hypothetical protein N0F65_004255 [Lagenidium giganteum]